MTSDFRPGKAYLIEGKDIEQVKNEIKDWFKKHEFEISEEDNMLGGYRLSFFTELWITLELNKKNSGTLLIFDQRFYKSDFRNALSRHKYLVEEARKDVIRFLKAKKTLVSNSFDRFTLIFSSPILFPLFTFFLSLFLSTNYTLDNYTQIMLRNIWYLSIIFAIILNYILESIWLKNKIQKLSNLPEYRVEEYKDKIDRLI